MYLAYTRSRIGYVYSFSIFTTPVFRYCYPSTSLSCCTLSVSENSPAHNSTRSSDLFDVPVTLRTVLEGLLAEHPSPEVLARYMPTVRSTLFKLLRGLQAKQAPYWAAISRARDSGRYSIVPGAADLRDG